jgi:hypothetical protein
VPKMRRKGSVFNKWWWEDCVFTCKRMQQF